jgi:hypothetical protein
MHPKELLFLLLFLTYPGFAQQDTLSTYVLGAGQDSYFGFYVTGTGSYPIAKNKSVTFYANFWTNPVFGNASTGTDFWTEVGTGINFTCLNQQFNFNPTLGFTYGKVLSGGEKGVLGDGLVPGALASFHNRRIDINAGAVWFKALQHTGPVTTDYVWFWFVPGYRLSNHLTAGIHLEDFYQSRQTGAIPRNLYLWMGPYLQFNFKNGVFLKVAAGYDPINHSFIKINTNIPLTN